MSNWIILIPTILTIIVCLWSKNVFVGMFVGIFSGCIILCGGNPLQGLGMTFDSLIDVVNNRWNTRLILFAVLIGGVIKLMNDSGAVKRCIRWLQVKAKVTTPGKAQFLTALVGIILFFDQYTSEAITATIGKTLSDNYGYSREKVAYLVDSTSSPMCALIPFNSWGAYIIGLLATLGVSDSMGVMVKALPVNFYCIFALVLCVVVSLKNWNIGPMKAAEAKAVKKETEKEEEIPNANPWGVVLPVLVIIISVVAAIYITGQGTFSNGSTDVAVFYAMIIGNIVALLLSVKSGMKWKDAIDSMGKGILEMVPVAMLLVFAFCLSGICGTLGIGGYISGLTAAHLPNFIVPVLVFLTGCLMAFSTGSSWGTFAIMIPIVVPMAEATGISLSLFVAAMLSGAIMGDHCSMISDSTVLASTFSECDNVQHFKTQVPYALIATAFAVVGFLIAGFCG